MKETVWLTISVATAMPTISVAILVADQSVSQEKESEQVLVTVQASFENLSRLYPSPPPPPSLGHG